MTQHPRAGTGNAISGVASGTVFRPDGLAARQWQVILPGPAQRAGLITTRFS
jgi:hypothetical protein